MLKEVAVPLVLALVMLNHKEAQLLEQESVTLMLKEVAVPLVLALVMLNHKVVLLLVLVSETL